MAPTYSLRHPWLNDLTARCFDPAFLDASRSPLALEQIVTEVHPGIVVFPLFSAEFCEALRDEARRYEHWCWHHAVAVGRPNSMNRYGLVLSEVGLDDALDRLMLDRLAPLTARHFAHHAGASLDHQHSFLVDYALEGDTELGFHVDNSEVTLNACLGTEFTGGEVYFRGERCAQHRQTDPAEHERYELAHRVGYAALHAGVHRHGVRALRSGQRTNLIAWFRSSRWRLQGRGTCGPWCGGR